MKPQDPYQKYVAALDDDKLEMERKGNHYNWLNATDDAEEEYQLARLESCQAEEGRRRAQKLAL